MTTTTISATATILLIDDDVEALGGLTSLLAAAGYAWHRAADDHAATDLATRVHPDLILCDSNLHGHSGVELCDQLKQLDGLADVPTMFLSGAQSPDIIRRARAWHVRKLLDPPVIMQLIEQALVESGHQLAHV